MESTFVSFNYRRRFGMEIELNAFDNRDFQRRPLKKSEYPAGADYIIKLLKNKLGEDVIAIRWQAVHNNRSWMLKPDSSCGMELCTPVLSGWGGIKTVVAAIDILSKDINIKCDKRCSLHTHVDVSDLTNEQVASVIAYWIKFEHIFLDSVPDSRKVNKYCQSIGVNALFQHDEYINGGRLINKLSAHKYWTLNTWRMCRGERKTIEFRIIENEGCKDAYLVKNWIRLILHFIEMAKDMPLPTYYTPGDRWSSLLWLDPMDLMKVLRFMGNNLSVGMMQTRNWFLARLQKNLEGELSGIWSKELRKNSKQQVDMIIKDLGIKNVNQYLSPMDHLSLFNNVS